MLPFEERPYRPCVGVMLLNSDNKIFVGHRIDAGRDGGWQMPQGGIDAGEAPQQAAFRELHEETGLDPSKAALLRESRDWITYDLPAALADKVWKGRYRGQKQRWFALRFLGQDSDMNLAAHVAEFDRWQWALPEFVQASVIAFKRGLYEQVLGEFQDLTAKGK